MPVSEKKQQRCGFELARLTEVSSKSALRTDALISPAVRKITNDSICRLVCKGWHFQDFS